MHRELIAAIELVQHWAMWPRALKYMCAVAHAAPEPTAAETDRLRTLLRAENDEAQPSRAARLDVREGVAIIPITGPISPTTTLWSLFFGGTSIERLRALFRAALSDDTITAIAFLCESPGGDVTGTPEFAAEIYKARGQKPMVAVVQYMAASGAYWLASQTGDIMSMPSGWSGSVGVYSLHEDLSGMLEEAGVVLTPIQFGQYKTEGAWWAPLSKDAQTFYQAQVNEFGNDFVKAVARGRGVTAAEVKAMYGEGRLFTARQALEVGMITGISSLETVVAKLAKAGGSRNRIARALSSEARATPRLDFANETAEEPAWPILEDGLPDPKSRAALDAQQAADREAQRAAEDEAALLAAGV